jgi:hypothetical protein
MRGRVPFDRLPLTSFFEDPFGNEKAAILQRWETDPSGDFDLAQNDEDFAKEVSKRPVVRVMHFADYDHDGQATEFYLQTGTISCGHVLGIVVGISKQNPRLHVFGTASEPSKPLSMQPHEWEALRDASAPIEVKDWLCGDHGALTQTSLQLRWTPQGIAGLRRTYECQPGGTLGKLVGEDPL